MIQRAFDLSRLGEKIARPGILRTPEEVLTATVRRLRRHRVPFLVDGGWALAAHGYARATDDFEFLSVLHEGALRRLESAMQDLGALLLRASSRTHLMFNATGWRLDFFMESPRGFAALKRRSVRRRFLRMVLLVVSRPDLIRRKLARGTLQDRAYVERLRGLGKKP
jgi:hypothetical protein